MREKLVGVLILMLAMSSCEIPREAHAPVVRKVDGYTLVEIKNGNVKIRYYGDYWFHHLNSKIIPGWNENIRKSFKLKGIQAPAIVYVAHTVLAPYYSTMALSYNLVCTESDFANKIAESLKSNAGIEKNLSNLNITKEDFGRAQAIKLSYELYNDKQRIWTRQIEFIINSKNKPLRIIFSTINSGVTEFEFEATEIFKTIQINQ